eukprot:Gb_29311 [translate_table: standard]
MSFEKQRSHVRVRQHELQLPARKKKIELPNLNLLLRRKLRYALPNIQTI